MLTLLPNLLAAAALLRYLYLTILLALSLRQMIGSRTEKRRMTFGDLVLGRVLTSAMPQIASSSRVNNACSFAKGWRGLRREGSLPTGLTHESHG